MKQKVILVVSVFIGILAFILTVQYVRGQRQKLEDERARIYAGAHQIRVVAAARDLPAGVQIKPGDLGWIKEYESHVRGQAVMPDQAKLLYGRKTLFSVEAKEPIFWSVIEGGAASAEGLAAIVKPGLRAISLSVSGAAAVSGMVQPHDRVDVLGTFTFPSQTLPGEVETVTLTVLQDVTVLATGTRLARHDTMTDRGSRASSYSTVTLAVTPREAEVLVFAQQIRGRLTLSLRHPSDVMYEQELPIVNFGHIQNELESLNEYRQSTIRHNPPPQR